MVRRLSHARVSDGIAVQALDVGMEISFQIASLQPMAGTHSSILWWQLLCGDVLQDGLPHGLLLLARVRVCGEEGSGQSVKRTLWIDSRAVNVYRYGSLPSASGAG